MVTEDTAHKKLRKTHEECTVVSSMRPLYICMNAIQRHHKCTYAMCYSCKIAEDESACARQAHANANRRSTRFDNSDEGNERRLRDKMNNKYDNDNRLDPEELKYSCRHNDRRSLIPFTGTEYFNAAYQEKIKSDKLPFPVKCDECRRKLKGGS